MLLVNTRNESTDRRAGAHCAPKRCSLQPPVIRGAGTRSSAFERRLKTASTAPPNVADINFPARETLAIGSSFLMRRVVGRRSVTLSKSFPVVSVSPRSCSHLVRDDSICRTDYTARKKNMAQLWRSSAFSFA